MHCTMLRLSRSAIIRQVPDIQKNIQGERPLLTVVRIVKNIILQNSVMRLQLMLHTVCKSKYYLNYMLLVLFLCFYN